MVNDIEHLKALLIKHIGSYFKVYKSEPSGYRYRLYDNALNPISTVSTPTINKLLAQKIIVPQLDRTYCLNPNWEIESNNDLPTWDKLKKANAVN
jgi:hypothetical protein